MPHIPILELRPELQEQNETPGDPDDPQDAVDNTEVNTEGSDETNTAEVEANTTFHNIEAAHTGANNGLIKRVKRFISKRKVNRRNIAVDRTGLMRAEDNNMPYGDDESSETDNEEDQQDGVPLVRRNKRI